MSKGKAIPTATNTTSDGRTIKKLNEFYSGSGYVLEETTYGVSVYSESGPFLFRRKTLDAVRAEITKRIEADALRWDGPASTEGATLKPAAKIVAKPDTSREALANALLDVLECSQPHDIKAMTGLPDARCEEIFAILGALNQGVKFTPGTQGAI